MDKSVSLSRGEKFNCGFARVAIWEFSQVSQGISRYSIDKNERAIKFRNLFDCAFEVAIGDDCWVASDAASKRDSEFDRYCDFIMEQFKKKWNYMPRQKYLETFATKKWKRLTLEQRKSHSLSKCLACASKYLEIQKSFPCGPCYVPEVKVTITLPTGGGCCSKSLPEKEVTRQFIAQSNAFFDETYDHGVIQSVKKHCPEERITYKETRAEKKAKDRKFKRAVVNACNKKFAQNAALNHLASGQSKAQYKRNRKEQSFESTLEETEPKPKKRHVNDAFVEKHRGKVIELLSNWPKDQTLNFSYIGEQCGLEEKNRGQLVKEVAEEIGFDLSEFEKLKSANSRVSKARLPGNEISVPCMPTYEYIENETSQLIESGVYTLGEPCVPHDIVKSTVTDGKIEKVVTQVYGRKIPLIEIRKRILKKHEEFMRLDSDETIESKLSLDEVKSKLECLGELNEVDDHRCKLKCLQRSRKLVLWHDHSTILGEGYILMTIHTLYDPAVYYSNDEYKALKKKNKKKLTKSIQSIVEEPELYMICLSSSSLKDQLATIADRLDCLSDLEEPIVTSSQIEINDSLEFFCGDHPAQSFERGTQVGGNYKCGSCGCRSDMMDDLAHAFNRPYRSLSDLQDIVLKGKYGGKKGILKPFSSLDTNQLREELKARGVFDVTGSKKELAPKLVEILRGAQRVPTILINNPSQPLTDINLGSYTVLDSEPLHDLKGHLINLLTELPHIFEGESKASVSDILQLKLFSKKQNGYSGSDLRTALIEVNNLLQDKQVNNDIKILLSTAVKISECLYSSDDKRTPKTILQLYNCTWLHHELCKLLIDRPKEVTYEKLFGLYLHSLVVHAPIQYEILCLRSVNTENQERMFQQAKHIASLKTNRQPENVIPAILLGIQAKDIKGTMSGIYHTAETRVQRVASKAPIYTGTTLAKTFVESRKHSWQAHLTRISAFLVIPKVWWDETSDCYVFRDSDSDPEVRVEGPCLKHFRSSSIKYIEGLWHKNWQFIAENNVSIPMKDIIRFDDNGDVCRPSTAYENIFSQENGSHENHFSSQEHESNGSIHVNVHEDTNNNNSGTLTYNIAVSTPVSKAIQDMSPISSVCVTTPTPVGGPTSSTPSCSQSTSVKNKSTKTARKLCLVDDNDSDDENCEIHYEAEGDTVTTAHVYKSAHGKTVALVIGDCFEAIKYDELHFKLKPICKKGKISSSLYNEYKDALAIVQSKVVAEKAAVDHVEKECYRKHEKVLPADSEMYTKYKNIKKLLRYWKIKL